MAQLIPVDHDPFDMAASLAAAGGDPLMPPPRNPAMPADWAQNAVRRVGGGLADILMAPRRAMDQGMTTAEAVPWAGNAALTLAGTGAPAAVRGAAGIFGGRLAKTADQAALSKAEELAKAGAPREQIWNDTGWFQGGDGKWRFEIPDKGASVSPGTGNHWDAAVEHPEFFKAYPSMGKYEANIDYGNQRGAYFGGGMRVVAPTRDDMGSVALHEMQHAVQDAEGLARGSAAESFKKTASDQTRAAFSQEPGRRYAELQAKRDAIPRTPLTPAEQSEMEAIYRDHFDTSRIMTDLYRRTAGEVEARNVQSRMNMTPEERRAKPPWLTEDVPAGQQIFGPASGSSQHQFPVDHDPFNVGSGAIIPPKQGIRAYHGSPHDFDRFDLSKIGTGEGAQSYGHGLYFAEAEPVAKQYRDNLGVYPAVNKLSFNPDGTPNRAGQAASELHAGFARDEIAHHFRVLDNRATPEQISKWIDEGASKLAEIEKSAGRIYEVNINAKPEQFLDWDRTLAGQPEIYDRLKTADKAFGRLPWDKTSVAYPTPGSTGSDALRAVESKLRYDASYSGNPIAPSQSYADASSAIRESGIPGIKYLDQGSRKIVDLEKIIDQSMSPDRVRLAKQELEQLSPSSNYVVFDDKIIDILHKYGIGGLSMLPPAVAAHVQSRLIPVDHDPFAQ